MDVPDAIVLDAWLQREIVVRGGVNVAAALADPSEAVALARLAGVLAAAPQVDPVRACVGWARSLLDPPETSLPIDARGSDLPGAVAGDLVPPAELASATLRMTMPAAELLVLFEFLCREIDEKDGADLLGAFVSPAEFWALNGLHCELEKGEFYSVVEEYVAQLDAARVRVVSSKVP